MAFLALAAPAFVGGLVTGFLKPSLPFRKGKRGEGFVLWPELAQVNTVSFSEHSLHSDMCVIVLTAALMCRASMKCYAWTSAQCCSWTTQTTPAG